MAHIYANNHPLKNVLKKHIPGLNYKNQGNAGERQMTINNEPEEIDSDVSQISMTPQERVKTMTNEQKGQYFENFLRSDEIWKHYNNLIEAQQRRVVEAYGNRVDMKTTGYCIIPRGQPGYELDRLVNVYQSFARLPMIDYTTGGVRKLEVGDTRVRADLTITPTECEIFFILNCKTPEVLKYLVDQGTITYCRRGRIGSATDRPITERGTIKIYNFEKPALTYRVRGATMDKIEEFRRAIIDNFHLQLGHRYTIQSNIDTKQISIYTDDNSTTTKTINIPTGQINIKIEFDSPDGVGMKTPVEGKILINVEGIGEVEVSVERLGGPVECAVCGGRSCSRNKCAKRCCYCYTDLELNKSHLESECPDRNKDLQTTNNNLKIQRKIDIINNTENAKAVKPLKPDGKIIEREEMMKIRVDQRKMTQITTNQRNQEMINRTRRWETIHVENPERADNIICQGLTRLSKKEEGNKKKAEERKMQVERQQRKMREYEEQQRKKKEDEKLLEEAIEKSRAEQAALDEAQQRMEEERIKWYEENKEKIDMAEAEVAATREKGDQEIREGRHGNVDLKNYIEGVEKMRREVYARIFPAGVPVKITPYRICENELPQYREQTDWAEDSENSHAWVLKEVDDSNWIKLTVAKTLSVIPETQDTDGSDSDDIEAMSSHESGEGG